MPGEVAVYQAVADRGELTTRTRLMFWVMPQATVADTLAYVDSLPAPGSAAAAGDGLGIWGLKLGMDGGVEGGFLCEPYANNPASAGTRSGSRTTSSRWWSTPSAAAGGSAAMPSATARSAASWMPTSRWRCGTRACRRERWSSSTPSWPTLPLAARAVRLGVGITVQHPLLYSLGGNLVRYWGPDRASQVMPVRAWVDEGALIAAGSDCNVSFFDPLLSIWGLVTRGTRTAGVQGPEYRVDTYTAIRLYTAAGGRLLREDRSVGILAPGAFADVVGFRADLLDCPVDDLPSQQPALTLVGGRPVHDPDGLFGSAGAPAPGSSR